VAKGFDSPQRTPKNCYIRMKFSSMASIALGKIRE